MHSMDSLESKTGTNWILAIIISLGIIIIEQFDFLEGVSVHIWKIDDTIWKRKEKRWDVMALSHSFHRAFPMNEMIFFLRIEDNATLEETKS